MQRSFSSFPGGWPAVGLLLLRSAAGLSLLAQGTVWISGRPGGLPAWAAGALALASGLLLVVGLQTPWASVLALLPALGGALAPRSVLTAMAGPLAALFVAVMVAALLFLGPGAFSLDARRFGRREVVIPSRPNRDRED